MEPKIQHEIESLKRELLSMGARVERNIGTAVQALTERNLEKARSVLDKDPEIDLAEIRIDRHCLDILALHQPVAKDLRFVTTTMKIVKDLERVGDTALDIARRSISALESGLFKDVTQFHGMSSLAQSMLNRSLDAFVRQDVTLAREVIAMDDELDDLHETACQELGRSMADEQLLITAGVHLLFVSGYLERIGDHSCNISEMVVFLVEGQDIRHWHKVKPLLE